MAAGSGARCGAPGRLQRRAAASGARAGLRGGPCRGAAPARGGAGCHGRPGGGGRLPDGCRVQPTSRCSHDLRAKGALAQIKQGDPKGALAALVGVRPNSVDGRLCEALTYSGAAALGAADPGHGHAQGGRGATTRTADRRRLGPRDRPRGPRRRQRTLAGNCTRASGPTCRTPASCRTWQCACSTGNCASLQRFLYGARPYPEVIAFAAGAGGRGPSDRRRARARFRRHLARRGRVAGRRSVRGRGASDAGGAPASCHRRRHRRGLLAAAAGRGVRCTAGGTTTPAP